MVSLLGFVFQSDGGRLTKKITPLKHQKKLRNNSPASRYRKGLFAVFGNADKEATRRHLVGRLEGGRTVPTSNHHEDLFSLLVSVWPKQPSAVLELELELELEIELELEPIWKEVFLLVQTTHNQQLPEQQDAVRLARHAINTEHVERQRQQVPAPPRN